MKTVYIVFIICFINVSISYAQIFGVYKDSEGHYLKFYSNNKLEFLLSESSGLDQTKIAGQGNLTIYKHKLKIRTKNDFLRGTSSSFNSIPNTSSKSKVLEIKIIDEYNLPILGVNVSFKLNKRLQGVVTDTNGVAKLSLTKMPNDSLLNISLIGYEPLRIRLPNLIGCTYRIKLRQGNFNYLDSRKIIINYNISGDTLFCKYRNKQQLFTLVK